MKSKEFQVGQHELDRLLIIAISTVCSAALILATVLTIAILKPTDQVWVKGLELTIQLGAAIGTAAAVIVALYFGLSTQRQQAAQAKAAGGLAAARIEYRLSQLRTNLSGLLFRLRSTKDTDWKLDTIRRFAKKMRETELHIFTAKELQGLLPLNDNCSYLIATGTEQLAFILRQEQRITPETTDEIDVDSRTELIVQWAEVFEQAGAMLNAAESIIKTATKSITAK